MTRAKKPGSRFIRRLRDRHFHIQGGLCCWCREPMDQLQKGVFPGPLTVTLEHVVPVSEGGLTNEENTAAAHYRCNWERSRPVSKKESQGVT
jgi:5-methylcytosine-specific restriction endonuclease McrA